MIDSAAAQKKYVFRTALFMGGYVLLNIGAITGAFDGLKGPGTWLFALTVAAPIAGHIWALLKLMQESDEFLRGLMAKRFIVASGIAMALFAAWGFMETYATAPHAPGFMLIALFWGCFGLVTPFIQTSH